MVRTLGPNVRRTLQHHIARTPERRTDSHYGGQAHREWADKVIARAGGRCQASGCGRNNCRLYADHIIEKKDGGPLFDLANGQALCGSCHTTKTNRAKGLRHVAPPPAQPI